MSEPLTTTPSIKNHLSSVLNGSAGTKSSHCRDHGAFDAIKMPNGEWSGCPACSQEESKAVSRAELAGNAESAGRRKLEAMREGSMIPRRFRDKTLDGYVTGDSREKKLAVTICRRYVEQFEDRLAQGGGLVMSGGVGTGKSHLAYAIGNALLDKRYSVMGIDVYELIDLIKEKAFSRKEQSSERAAIKAFVSGLDLLILDEVGASLGTEWERLQLFKIINERYKEQLPTILISNVDRDELSVYLGERIVDRMEEGGGATVTMDWESYRSQGVSHA